MRIKQQLLRWLLKNEGIEISVRSFQVLGKLATTTQLRAGTELQLDEPGQTIRIRIGPPFDGIALLSLKNTEGAKDLADLERIVRASKAEVAEAVTGCIDPNCPRHGHLIRETRNREELAKLREEVFDPEAQKNGKLADFNGYVPDDTTLKGPQTPNFPPETTKAMASVPIAMKAIALAVKRGWTLKKANPASRYMQFTREGQLLAVYWNAEHGNYVVIQEEGHAPRGIDELQLESIFQNPVGYL